MFTRQSFVSNSSNLRLRLKSSTAFRVRRLSSPELSEVSKVTPSTSDTESYKSRRRPSCDFLVNEENPNVRPGISFDDDGRY